MAVIIILSVVLIHYRLVLDKGDKMKKIIYIGYYDTKNNEKENRNYVLSAVNKMTYICSAINKTGNDVEIVSASETKNPQSYSSKMVDVFPNTKLKLFKTSAYNKNRIVRVLNRILFFIKFSFYVLNNTDKNQNVIVYHSLGYARLIKRLKKIKKFNLILEVEEIYSDVTGNNKTLKTEQKLFDVADAYIFPTELLDKKVNIGKKPSVIIYGTYQVEEAREKKLFSDEKIHCVYAGTFDPRKGGAIAAVKAAQYLDENHHMHIIGFGSEEDKINLLAEIEKVRNASKATVTYDGLFSGEEYIEFIQSCDIGLSTQNPDAAFNDTSFPSKILSYLANGLRVVSIRIPVVETSKIGDMLFYYDEQTPQDIAKAIMSVDMKKEYNSRNKISELDKNFTDDITKLLN